MFISDISKRQIGRSISVTLQLAFLAVCGSAFAADLPNTKAPVYVAPPPPIFSWTGFYGGVTGGYSIDHTSYPFTEVVGPGTVLGRSGLTQHGPSAGVQIGYNYQLSNLPLVGNHLVVGVEADAAWSDINGVSTTPTVLGPATFGTRIQSFGGIEGRIGYAFDHLLIFLEGGVPYATVKSYFNAAGFNGSITETRFRIGRQNLVGAGFEYALNENWSIRADYVYSYIGAWTASFAPAPGANFDFMTRASFHTARASVDYHFDLFAPPTPIAAKY